MKLLLDQGLPRSTIQHLGALGISAEHVGDRGMATATDAEIVAVAKDEHAIVVTLDADFHQWLATSRADTPSVIRIRIEGLTGAELAAILATVTTSAEDELNAGAVASVTRNRIRVRRLPIGD